MTKKDQEQVKEIISNEISKNFRKLEKKILQEVVGESMAEIVKLALVEVFEEAENSDKRERYSESTDDEELSHEITWAFKVYGGRNYVPMSTKQFLNTIKSITDRAVLDNTKERAPFSNHDEFVEELNIPNARNAQVFALKQIYDLIRWSSKNDALQGRTGQIGEA